MLNDTSHLDSTDSSTSTDVLDEMVVPINQLKSNRKKKIHKEHHSFDNQSCGKQRKKVSFWEDQQNSPQLSVNTISMTEITPILDSYGQQLKTFQTSQTFLKLWLQIVEQLISQTPPSHWFSLFHIIMNSIQ